MLRWLRTDSGQEPHLRSQAKQVRRRIDRAARQGPPKFGRDSIVHPWEWNSEVVFADWASGTIDLRERVEGGQPAFVVEMIGASVSRDDLRLRTGAPIANTVADALPPHNVAGTPTGRRPAHYWEACMIEMAGQLYLGDLQPGAQADIERAMIDWLERHGFSASEKSVRDHARPLWKRLDKG